MLDMPYAFPYGDAMPADTNDPLDRLITTMSQTMRVNGQPANDYPVFRTQRTQQRVLKTTIGLTVVLVLAAGLGFILNGTPAYAALAAAAAVYGLTLHLLNRTDSRRLNPPTGPLRKTS